jgi:hypothetical protein
MFAAMERALERERVHNVEVTEYNDSTSRLFCLLYLEACAVEAETCVFLATKKWQNPELCVFDSAIILEIFECAAVEENILLPGVSMIVTVQNHFSLPMHEPNQLL